MAEPAPAPGEFAGLTSAPTELVDTVGSGLVPIGPYHLLQRIAEGGMGEVWLAEQKHPIRRRVALKLVRAGMDSRDIMLRFESERQALALMDHPAIAAVYDAGSTAEGKPYFAMEYVPGIPISDFCVRHKLSIAERLELFIHVCEGVQHAHQKAIIHRDLKPSNILVMEIDGKPAPKIIDFGIAKAVGQRLVEQTIFTRVGSIVGTPEYMSPEQAGSGGEDIDTRSDIYSLGVILYELLAGVPPLQLQSCSYLEFVRKVHEAETPKPSTKVRSLTAAVRNGAGGRDAASELLAKQLRGDLDCITLKCLEKDRGRRYPTPSELAADIRRYLDGQPVLATSPSPAYRVGKFVRRNRAAVSAVLALLIVLVAGAAISIFLAVRARNAERLALLQRDRADAEAATAAAVSEFVQNDLLSQAGADGQGGDAPPDPDVKMRTLVDRAAAAVPKKFAGKPAVEADLRKTLGETYLSLGLLDKAQSQLEQSYELNRHAHGAASKKTIEALLSLGSVEFNSGRYAESAAHQAAAAESARKLLGPDADLTLQATQSVAVDYSIMGQADKAEPLLKDVLERQVRKLGYDNAQTLDTSDSLAFIYMNDGRYDEAKQLLERGLQSYRRLFGPDHPNTQRELFGLARVSLNAGNFEEAETTAKAVYSSNLRLLGPSHFKTLLTANTLARAYLAEGKIGEAEALMRPTLAKMVATLGEDNVDTLNAKGTMAAVYERQNKFGEAEALLADVERRADKSYGASTPESFVARQALARNLLHQGKCEDAMPLLTEAARRWESFAKPDWRRFEAQCLLGQAFACRKDFSAAERYLLSGYRGLQQSAPRMPAIHRGKAKAAAGDLAQLYTSWNKPADAEQWRRETQ